MPKPSTTALADMLELLARILHARGFHHGMFPAQWMALRYFARARRELCTASELARFQGMANGPVSRTVRTLLQKGLLVKAKDKPRGKAEILELTSAGRALLKLDPVHEIELILASLTEEAQSAFNSVLDLLINKLSVTEAKAA